MRVIGVLLLTQNELALWYTEPLCAQKHITSPIGSCDKEVLPPRTDVIHHKDGHFASKLRIAGFFYGCSLDLEQYQNTFALQLQILIRP